MSLGYYITFVREIKAGEAYVAPFKKLVAHYLEYGQRSKLPRCHAVLTMPLVLPDGRLLTGRGLNRDYDLVFGLIKSF